MAKITEKRQAEIRKELRSRFRKGLGSTKRLREFVAKSGNAATKAEFARAKEIDKISFGKGTKNKKESAKKFAGSKGRQKAGKVGDLKKFRAAIDKRRKLGILRETFRGKKKK